MSEFKEQTCSSMQSENDFQSLLFKSLNREKELERLLDQQRKINDQLKLKLEMERRETTTKVESSEDSEEMQSLSFSVEGEDLKETFGTSSSVLMQYKFDDLRQSYSRCVMKLAKKSKQMKKLLSENELLKFKNDQLSEENSELGVEKIKLNRKIEKICFRFLDLMDRRSDERDELKAQLDTLTMELKRLEELCLSL